MLKELEKTYGVVGLKGLEAKALEAFKALEVIQKKQEAEAKAKELAFKLEVAEALAQKPETCEAAIRGCAVAYESHDCNGGWKLPIGQVTWNCLTLKKMEPSFTGRDEVQVVHKNLQVQVSCHSPSIYFPKTQRETAKPCKMRMLLVI